MLRTTNAIEARVGKQWVCEDSKTFPRSPQSRSSSPTCIHVDKEVDSLGAQLPYRAVSERNEVESSSRAAMMLSDIPFVTVTSEGIVMQVTATSPTTFPTPLSAQSQQNTAIQLPYLSRIRNGKEYKEREETAQEDSRGHILNLVDQAHTFPFSPYALLFSLFLLLFSHPLLLFWHVRSLRLVLFTSSTSPSLLGIYLKGE